MSIVNAGAIGIGHPEHGKSISFGGIAGKQDTKIAFLGEDEVGLLEPQPFIAQLRTSVNLDRRRASLRDRLVRKVVTAPLSGLGAVPLGGRKNADRRIVDAGLGPGSDLDPEEEAIRIGLANCTRKHQPSRVIPGEARRSARSSLKVISA